MTTSSIRPLRTVLVANRGEIAVRVMRTAKAMGLGTVAVHSEADRDALHVRTAGTAVLIGPAPARQSYLDVAAILDTARATGADAIHPGYGFLSENADFAEAVANAGLIFIGPPAAAIRAMGSKSAAKALMEEAGVPLVPGYHGVDQDPGLLAREAERIGYPVLIKASAGGGGKGMKVVERAADFAKALASAKREAKNAFGDDRVLIEKYLTRPRHIEIQVFADGHGNAVSLFERDCSIQRRHQKVLEEAPAPGLTAEKRAAMGRAAVEAAKAVGYVGAGTVEFIAEGDGFYFMEMNTRLQVEHPVTEAITGLDLVEWQIRIARGEPLPVRAEDLAIRGHAIEARLYAEDPDKGFLPQTGRLAHLALPEGLPGIRVDAGIAAGDAVSQHYDPMIAKIIAHGASRDEALARLAIALERTEVVGIKTNRAFLARIARHPAFATAALDTGFIERHRADLVPEPAPVGLDRLALGVAAHLDRAVQAAEAATDPADPWSPWASAGAFRLNRPRTVDLVIEVDGAERRISAEYTGARLNIREAGQADTDIAIEARFGADGRFDAVIGSGIGARRVSGRAVVSGGRMTIFADGQETVVRFVDPRDGAGHAGHHAGRLVSPMPGSVVRVDIAVGAKVAKGQPLVVVEAMKMEHVVSAPADGTITAVKVGVGDVVQEGAELVGMDEA